MPLSTTASELDALLRTVAAVGGPLEIALALAGAALLALAVVPAARAWLPRALYATFALLAAGEAVLGWMHWRLWRIAEVVSPETGAVTGRVAVPLWVESEKLYVWALVLAGMALLVRRYRDELLPWLAGAVGLLALGASLTGSPFTDPLPGFLGQYRQYLSAMLSGVPQAAFGAFQGMEASRQFYYNTWYMWVHPPLLFVAYGAFVVSFAAILLTIRHRHSSYESVAYGWARLGYLPLTAGMLLGVPWAIMAWQGESWWWSGKVNMSIMMWLLYTAYLHGRLYLRRRGMWRWVVALAALSFVTLALTYLATYVVPGAHSYA
ncbi:MAG: cytochrome c biogenesis protein CcsA [Coriobacteriia bacterium]|nr:cytochrome c biogenesis protein CcsA [Coriobacteriia bacterium]